MCASPPLRRDRGLSLIELMVGIVVAMLVALAAAGSAIFFTASQRQGVGTSAAVALTASALAAMKEDVAQAGLGFTASALYGCTSLNLSAGPQTLTQASFSPLQVASAGGFDRLDVFYGGQVAGGAAVALAAPSDTRAADLGSYLPVAVGDAVLFSRAADVSPGPCTIRTVTHIAPATATTPLRLGLAPSGVHNQVAFTPAASYLIKDTLTPIGALTWHRYRVDGSGNLILEWPMEDRRATLLRGVVAFRVQYGVAAASAAPAARNTTVTEWVDAADIGTVLDPAAMRRVRALRIGIVARSAQPERPAANGTCSASQDAPRLFGDQVPLTGNWQCFRYRTGTEILPLRNFMMGMS